MSSKILFGFHAVTVRLKTAPESIVEIHVDSTRRDARMRQFVDRARDAGARIVDSDDERLARLAGTARHQGVVARVTPLAPRHSLDEVLDEAQGPALVLVLDGVTDPHNLGACLRNADAFGAQAVIVPKDRSVGVNATVAKAASGAADTVPVVTVTNLARAIATMKAKGVWVLGADTGGENIVDADLSGPVAWVLGAEGQGLRRLTRESCDRIVGIPLTGSVESLNVSVAAGICLYATRAARSKAAGGKPPR